MNFKYYIIRVKKYFKNYGLKSVLMRILEIIKRNFFQNRNIIYFLKMDEIINNGLIKPIGIKVNQRKKIAEIDNYELNVLNEYLGRSFVKKIFTIRYSEGATIWTIYENEKLVGYLWTIKGKPLKKHFFYHITNTDIEIFDVVIFSDHRGKKLYSKSIEFILNKFIDQKIDRVFTKIKIWNEPAIKAATRTHWKKLGIASQIKIFKVSIIIWYKKIEKNE